MKILITGGAGFIGSHLCAGLAARHPEWNITVLDNLHRRGAHINLERVMSAGARFVHGDVRIPSDWAALKDQTTLILHCAAEPSVLAGIADQNPAYCVETNLLGTLHCLEYARRCGADLFFISTSKVYPMGQVEALSFVETDTRFDLLDSFVGKGVSFHGINEQLPMDGVRSLYGASKLASELLIAEYAAAYGLKAVVNRCGVITGPGQMGKLDQGIFSFWVAAHMMGQPLSYIGYQGSGKQVRDYLHISDFVDLVARQLSRFSQLSGKTFNVGGGRSNSISLVELTELCQSVTSRTVPISTKFTTRPNDVCWYISDTRRVTNECDWHPAKTVIDMASDIHNWLCNNKQRLESIFDFGGNDRSH